MSEHEIFAPFWDHAEELRKLIIRSLYIILIGMGLSFYFHHFLFNVLTYPLEQTAETQDLKQQTLKQERLTNESKKIVKYYVKDNEKILNHSSDVNHESNFYLIPPKGFVDLEKVISKNDLLILSPIEGFSTSLKVSFWSGLVATSPIWLFMILQFITPGLLAKEKRLIFPFFFLSLLFLCLGGAFAFYVTIPISNHYLYSFNEGIGLNLWSLSHYLDYTVFLLLANGLVFELCVIGLLLVQLNVLKADNMARFRRHMIVAAFILGALLTPPDIFSQFMLAIPIISLYEIVIIYARLREKFKIRQLVHE